jgi:(heptosyl)LPS beta-1,4-glucosyltransferase
MASGISVVINTFNEEANIADCIRSVETLADEIVVCDMHSRDRTGEIAMERGARVVLVDPAYCDFGRLRYFAVSQAASEWVLVLDADERMTPPLADELLRIASANSVDVVRFSSLYWYFGGWVRHGGFFSDIWIRFFRREVYLSRYQDFDEPLHQDFSVLYDVTNVLVLPKSFYIEHYAYPTIEKYMTKTLGLYARVEAEQLFKRGRNFRRSRLLLQPVKVLLRSFVLQQGYKDGCRGLILAVLFAGYHFAIWANLWLLEEQARYRRATPQASTAQAQDITPTSRPRN